jgi:hypothetical protein
MKLACLLSTTLLGWCAVASTQNRADTALPPVQAPPALNEPGTAAAPNSAPANAPTVADPGTPVSKSAESPGLPADVQAAAEAAELPVITVRQQGTDTVEEYRKRGKLYFVRVISNEGPTRFYVDNRASVPPNIMQQLSGPSGVVQPVYYKLADWK